MKIMLVISQPACQIISEEDSFRFVYFEVRISNYPSVTSQPTHPGGIYAHALSELNAIEFFVQFNSLSTHI